MLVDTHTHYYDSRFDEDMHDILSSLSQNNVGYIINAGCDVLSSKAAITIAQSYDFAYATVGIHPNNTEDVSEDDYKAIEELAAEKKVVAIGEIGLDYHFDNSKALQREAFVRQIDIASRTKLPFVIHCREACGDCLDILRAEYKGGGAVMHCFGESVETAKIILDMGLFVSIGGTVTFKNNVRAVEAVKYIPLESILLETDCPYLAPTPHRGERNSSLYIHYVAEKIAEIKGISVEEVENVTAGNAERLFRFNK